MTPKQVELVAKAFYTAEYSGEWDEAPEPLRDRFRELAQAAIWLLSQQIAQCQSLPIPASRDRRVDPQDMLQH